MPQSIIEAKCAPSEDQTKKSRAPCRLEHGKGAEEMAERRRVPITGGGGAYPPIGLIDAPGGNRAARGGSRPFLTIFSVFRASSL